MVDFITAVLTEWRDAVRLRALVDVLLAAVTALRGDDGAGDAHFALTCPLVTVQRQPAVALSVPAALEALASDLATPPERRSIARHERLVDAARAYFLLLFLQDFRVRRLVLAAHGSLHALWHTRAPERDRACRFLDNGVAVAVAKDYASTTAFMAAETPDDHARFGALTRDFVAYLGLWWACDMPPPLPLRRLSAATGDAEEEEDVAALAPVPGDEERQRLRRLQHATAAPALQAAAVAREQRMFLEMAAGGGRGKSTTVT